ncbi:MAG: N-acetylmuramoyl-L-alanine amidase [Sphingomonadales bacterium]
MTWADRYLGAAVIGLMLLLFPAPSYAQSLEVSAARVGIRSPDTLRLVLESNSALKPTISYLSTPDRIVIDLPRLDFSFGPGITDGKRFIETYRYGAFSPKVSRLVIDLSKPARVTRSFTLKPSGKTVVYRTVFDISIVPRARFTEEVARTKGQLIDPQSRRVEPVLSAAARNGEKPGIVIDAGHGGNDPGTIGINGRAEKEIVLAVALKLRASLQRTGQFTPVLTRDHDIYVGLKRRVEIARANEADLMLSLHADSIGDKNFRGGTIYTLSEKASDSVAANLAARENKSDILVGMDLEQENAFVRDILITLAQRETKNFSVKFANILISEMGQQRLIPRRPHRYAGFVVLKAPDVPSVLVEMGYMSNAQDAMRLASKQGQDAVVRDLTDAVTEYFAQLQLN